MKKPLAERLTTALWLMLKCIQKNFKECLFSAYVLGIKE